MAYSTTDTELEAELQEVYKQATHWLQDISFLETETHFFKGLIDRYRPTPPTDNRQQGFYEKIRLQHERLKTLKARIPEFLAFVQPFLGDLKKPMHVDFLNRYNTLNAELTALFQAVSQTKKELFQYTETIMLPKKSPSA